MTTVISLVTAVAGILAVAAVLVAAVALEEEDDSLPPDWEEPDSERARRLRGE